MTQARTFSLGLKLDIIDRYKVELTISTGAGQSITMPLSRDMLFERVEEVVSNNLRRGVRDLVAVMQLDAVK